MDKECLNCKILICNVAACNFIRRGREVQRKNRKSKGIAIKIEKEDNIDILARLTTTCNIVTNVFTFTHCLLIKGIFIYPTTRQSNKCIKYYKKNQRKLVETL